MIVQRCQEQGWKNYLVLSHLPENPVLVEPFTQAGCEIVLQPRSRRDLDPASVWRVRKLLRRTQCNVFHCHNDHTSPLLGAVLAGVPVRVWSKLGMSSYHERGVPPKGWHRLHLSTRLSCWCAHRVLAISQDVCTELVDQGCPERRVEVVHGAVDLQRFITATSGAIRHDLGLDPSDVLISAVGRAIHRKGWDIAIKAFAKVQKSTPAVRLVLVGSTVAPEEAGVFRQLTQLAVDCGVSQYVHFLGHRNDYAQVLKASDIFILPSRSEGLPGALLEAMAAGLPCIATNECGMKELITHGENGMLFEKEREDALAERLIELIENQSLRARIAAQASQRVAAFSMDAYADRVVGCYNALLSGISAR